jgi:hypothetical protein
VKRLTNHWTVEVFVFSGRQNPTWKLSEKQASDWMEHWQKSPSSEKEVQQPSRLGYTGCKLQYNEHSHWFVYNGCVSFYENEKVVFKKDEDRKLEYFLLNTASGENNKILRGLKLI